MCLLSAQEEESIRHDVAGDTNVSKPYEKAWKTKTLKIESSNTLWKN
jgi:hypothetical protein